MNIWSPRSAGVATSVLCAVATVSSAAPAVAAEQHEAAPYTVTIRDARHDIVRGNADAKQKPSKATPGRSEGDVLSLRAFHGKHRVHVRIHFAKLTSQRRLHAVHVFDFRTADGTRAEMVVFGSGWTSGIRQDWTVTNKPAATCAGAQSTINYRRNTVRVQVPRRCLGNPRWVRVGEASGTWVRPTIYWDDAHRDGSLGNRVALGPRVYRR